MIMVVWKKGKFLDRKLRKLWKTLEWNGIEHNDDDDGGDVGGDGNNV